MDETDQVVPPPGVGHFMDENCVELTVGQQSIDTERQRDIWARDSVD